jgi:hypothetical protein
MVSVPAIVATALMPIAITLFAFGVRSAVGLLPFLKVDERIWVAGVWGFVPGGVFGGVLSAVLFFASGGPSASNDIFFSLPGIILPCAGGGWRSP